MCAFDSTNARRSIRALTYLFCVMTATLMGIATVSAQPTRNACKVVDPELQGSYAGGCVNGWAEGSGEAVGSAHYKGEFKSGKKQGKGIKSWLATGDHYDGDFIDDRKEGTGTYVWGARSAWPGEKYFGAYVNDLRHGYGTYEWSRTDRYTGAWENDFATGPTTPTMRARARAHAESVAAVGRPGIAVCRNMKVGIATIERIKGTVISADDDSVSVRIDDAGTMGHIIRGNALRQGTLIADDYANWAPC